ncbi:MAG: type III pantothenate kinase, partial [Chloroflexota bacterium]
MLVAADIDNTRVAVGVFAGAELHASFALATDVRRTEDEYAFLLAGLLRERETPLADVRGVALASVVPALSEMFARVAERLFGVAPLVVGGGARTGIRIATQNPREVGENRIVNAVAAFHLHGGPAIVVDFGTATSFDVIGEDGAYLGGATAPGLALAAEALTDRAARLFRVELTAPRAVVGRGTASALQSGIVLGHA